VPVILAVLSGALGGCDTRTRDNPLDPQNPGTSGVVANFNAVAGDGQVSLNWSDLGIGDLDQIVLLRWSAGDEAETLAVLPAHITDWVDTTARNDSTYRYRAAYVVRDDPSFHPSNEDLATPGTGQVWVVDESRGGLWRVSPDGRDRVWKLSYAGYLRSLAVDRVRERVWVASWSQDEVLAVDTSGNILETIEVDYPRKIAVDESDGSVWLAADWGVSHYSSSGQRLFADSTVSEPKDIAIDQTRGTCWVAEGTGSLWIRYVSGDTRRVYDFDYPFSVAVVEADGGAWVVDAGLRRVYRMENGGVAVRDWVGNLAQPVDVAVSPSGEAWVADWDANAVVRLSDAVERVDHIGGLNRPRGVATSDSGQVVWVVEAMGGRVNRIAIDGERLGSTGGLDFPKDIAVED
jgi:sugar lactone lactonase YvrE